jgi:SAM-dependent methyltransferase
MNLTDKLFSSLFLGSIPSVGVMTISLQEYLQFEQISPELIYDKLSREPAGRVIDLGCGTGRVLRYFGKAGWECHGVDISPESGKEASQVCQFHLRDGEEPLHWFSDDSFDVALAIAVYHHIADVDFSLDELVRCLKPGGLLVIHEVVDDDPVFRMVRSAHPDYKGMPVLSRMRSRDWATAFDRRGLNGLAAFGLSLREFGKWKLMEHAFPEKFGRQELTYPFSLFPPFMASAVKPGGARPVHVLYMLQKPDVAKARRS